MKLFTLAIISLNFILLKSTIDKHEVYQITYYHPEFESKDSVVLTKSLNHLIFHDKIQIFRAKRKIFELGDLEINVTQSWFKEHSNGHGEYLYIVTIFNAPDPDKFLIIETTKNQTIIFGTTEPSTAEIFGDVDNDGKFEIGVINGWCQGGDNNCNSIDNYRAFEIADNFPTDKTLNDFFKQFLKKK